MKKRKSATSPERAAMDEHARALMDQIGMVTPMYLLNFAIHQKSFKLDLRRYQSSE